jgi:hypothetical protein
MPFVRPPLPVWCLAGLLLMLAVGGLYGGGMMLADPSGGLLQMDDVLPSLLVPDYLLPGLFLVLVMGLVPIVLIYALLRQPHWWWAEALPHFGQQYWAWTATLALGILLVLWLALQAALIGFRWPIQYATAGLGVLIVAVTAMPAVRHRYRRSTRRHRRHAHSSDERSCS